MITLIKTAADRIGLDPWDVEPRRIRAFIHAHEQPPVSRFRWGSPCRFIRRVDIAVHIILPAMLEERWPRPAQYLRSTSPRWGRKWRHW